MSENSPAYLAIALNSKFHEGYGNVGTYFSVEGDGLVCTAAHLTAPADAMHQSAGREMRAHWAEALTASGIPVEPDALQITPVYGAKGSATVQYTVPFADLNAGAVNNTMNDALPELGDAQKHAIGRKPPAPAKPTSAMGM